MKKAKIVLSAIVMMAVVGGALAFKAKAFHPTNVFCSDPNSPTPACTIPTPFQTAHIGQPVTTDPCADGTGVYYTTTVDCNTPTTGQVFSTNPS